MERTPVKSSSIRSVGYDPETRMLEVEFASGAVYQHQDVPPELHKGLTDAESPGRFYQQNLRGRFRYVKAEA